MAIGAAAGSWGCRAAPATGSCDVVYRFENVRREPSSGADEWTDISRVLNRYAAGSVPAPKVSNVKALPRGEVRTCEVPVTLGSMGDLARVEGELQALAEQHAGQKRLEFSLARATMIYRSNFVGADLEVTLRGVAADGYRVVVYPTGDGSAQRTTAGVGGAWSIRLSGVPASRQVYGYSQDPEGRVRTKFFRLDVNSMRQEAVGKAEFVKAIGVDPDVAEAKAAVGKGSGARAEVDGRSDRDWYKDPESDRKWRGRDGEGERPRK